MGMYTELVMAIELKRDTPQEIIEVLKYLLEPGWDKVFPETTFSHPLYNTEHLEFILQGDSYYFPGISGSKLEYDNIARAHFLTIRSNLKNYDREIQKFLHWLAPYSQTGTFTPAKNGFPPTSPGRDFAGYFFYEEDERPTMIFFHEGKVYLSEVKDVELQEIAF